jgi:APA family basic amino acid/polyamine antiporter
LKWRRIDHRTVETPRLVRDLIVAVISLVFSVLFIVHSRNTGQLLGLLGPFFLAGAALLLGIPVYHAERSHMTEPDPVPGVPVRKVGGWRGAAL